MLYVSTESEQAMATHSSILAWKIPRMEEPGRLQSMGLLSWTRLSDFTFTFHFHALEKEMATHSSILTWWIPGTAEPSRLPSMGSHRVGHDWHDIAAAVAAQMVLWRRYFSVPILQMGNWGREVGASLIIAARFSAVLCTKTLWEFHKCQALSKMLQLQAETLPSKAYGLEVMEAQNKSCIVPQEEKPLWRECSGIPWHVKLVWAGSVLQYNVAFLNWASTKGFHLLSAFCCSRLSAHPHTDTCFVSVYVLFSSSSYFSFFTMFHFFCVLIIEGKFNKTQGLSAEEAGWNSHRGLCLAWAYVWTPCEEITGAVLKLRTGDT